jgi:hypothetical protein
LLPQTIVAGSHAMVLITAMASAAHLDTDPNVLFELEVDEQPLAPPRMADADLVTGIELYEETLVALPPAIEGAIEIDPIHPLRRLGSWLERAT